MFRSVTPETVKVMLATLADDMAAAPPDALKEALRSVVERIELSPDTFVASITYRVTPAVKAGSSWRPHGDSNPGSHRERVLS